MSRSQLTATLGTILLIGGLPSVAAASPYDGPPVMVKVKATDADLHTPQGARQLAARITMAAQRACGGNIYPLYLRAGSGFYQCRATAVDRAIKDLDAPLVAAALGRSRQIVASTAR
jgi:UrcA family protein